MVQIHILFWQYESHAKKLQNLIEMEILGKSIMLAEFFLIMIYVHSQIKFTKNKPQACNSFKLCEDVTVWDAVFTPSNY